MSLVVFAGPTLPRAEIAAHLDAIVLPPAAQGDLWRAVRRHRPVAIGLIDGLFRATRAVWHREILWALSEGVHVLGAASMGALRAAELHPFGMRGVGRVFEAYAAGAWDGAVFEDDDEVAVEHAPAELGDAPLSTAMVDLRDTLGATLAAGALDKATHDRLLAHAKATPYPQRSLAALGRAAGLDLSQFHVPRKRLDALALLDALAELRNVAPFVPGFRFQPTLIWERFVAVAEAEGEGADDVLDELRLDPVRWRAACLAATGRLATRGSDPVDLDAALSRFRQARGLLRRDQLAAWMTANALDEAGLVRLLRSDPDAFPTPPSDAALLAELRATGAFGALRSAATARRGLAVARPDGPLLDAALDWYFARVPGGRPASLADHVAALGWADNAHFERTVADAYRRALLHNAQAVPA